MFTRAHYAKVAAVIREVSQHRSPAAALMVAEAFRDMFAQDNPRFNAEKFMRACGVVQW